MPFLKSLDITDAWRNETSSLVPLGSWRKTRYFFLVIFKIRLPQQHHLLGVPGVQKALVKRSTCRGLKGSTSLEKSLKEGTFWPGDLEDLWRSEISMFRLPARRNCDIQDIQVKNWSALNSQGSASLTMFKVFQKMFLTLPKILLTGSEAGDGGT